MATIEIIGTADSLARPPMLVVAAVTLKLMLMLLTSGDSVDVITSGDDVIAPSQYRGLQQYDV